MKGWYSVSLIGWFVTLVHLLLSFTIVLGVWKLDPASPEVEFFYGAFYIEVLVFLILLYARFTKKKLFAKK